MGPKGGLGIGEEARQSDKQEERGGREENEDGEGQFGLPRGQLVSHPRKWEKDGKVEEGGRWAGDREGGGSQDEALAFLALVSLSVKWSPKLWADWEELMRESMSSA